MAYKDPEKQREYQREWQRQQRAAKVKPSTSRTLHPEDVRTAQGIRNLLAEVLAEVQAWSGDTLIRARCIGYLAAVALKAVETADLEQRISSLEEQINQTRSELH